MPFIQQSGPYAAEPRVADPSPTRPWDGDLHADDGVAVLRDVSVDSLPPLDGIAELHLVDCNARGLSLSSTDNLTVVIERSTLTTCDLSQVRVSALLESSIHNSKLLGTDFSDAEVADVSIDGCVLRYLSLRMASLVRVAIARSEMTEIDLHDSSLRDVSFAGTDLDQVSLDRCRLERVDFTEASRLGLVSPPKMNGATITERQVIELAYQFALASGVDIETTKEPQ